MLNLRLDYNNFLIVALTLLGVFFGIVIIKSTLLVGAAVGEVLITPGFEGYTQQEVQESFRSYCETNIKIPYFDDEGNQEYSCCGNGLCEGAEDESNCDRDCKLFETEEFLIDDVIEDAVGDAIPAKMLEKIQPLIGKQVVFQIIDSEGERTNYVVSIEEDKVTVSKERSEEED